MFFTRPHGATLPRTPRHGRVLLVLVRSWQKERTLPYLSARLWGTHPLQCKPATLRHQNKHFFPKSIWSSGSHTWEQPQQPQNAVCTEKRQLSGRGGGGGGVAGAGPMGQVSARCSYEGQGQSWAAGKQDGIHSGLTNAAYTFANFFALSNHHGGYTAFPRGFQEAPKLQHTETKKKLNK